MSSNTVSVTFVCYKPRFYLIDIATVFSFTLLKRISQIRSVISTEIKLVKPINVLNVMKMASDLIESFMPSF